MAVFAPYAYSVPPAPKRRRTATAVLAGDFDPRPARDVLTSLLNGVPVNKEVEDREEARRVRKRKEKEREGEREKEREKDKDKEREREKEREKEKKRARPGLKVTTTIPITSGSLMHASGSTSSTSKRAPSVVHAPATHQPPQPSSFWQARPAIHITGAQRSVSVTPPPMGPSSPPTTPGPSVSSTVSATSSKRLFTPDDDEDLRGVTPVPQPHPTRPRKKRTAVKKGWKGWVEGSPPPSEKLINLDSVTVLTERKTRSGKSFDAIGVGKDGWV
ncbi:uncharacterized protein LAESUDRAFT_727975 [Laetiporus sulphureus 93-53]|uniref:Uncharacterized protein n=1 Tax=Laetiporus sulphureus 93-53 TaxID=1314785 RepID=A0A165DBP6_9APHY|nr:uncharacterized protein LAESUDRAFT_727975 [Laetiporus sulphureus 93-53]KZT04497.1 hypothetical protein LAESUDRAFT_727975 [Laetiporus sulphureus 93-53]